MSINQNNLFDQNLTYWERAAETKWGSYLTEIDLSVSSGIERVEAILSCCQQLNLLILIHGGRSAILKELGRDNFSIINNLAQIDWGISSAPVIFAHAAAFDIPADTLERDVFPKPRELLSRHGNLLLDISGLNLLN